MENDPFEDVFPIENGDFPLLCLITGVYLYSCEIIHLHPKKPAMTSQELANLFQDSGWKNIFQWLFLVLVIGGRDYIVPQVRQGL